MARDDFIALCAGFVMCTGGIGLGWFITPEPAKMKLAKIRASLDPSIPIRTLPPDTKIIDCVLTSVGGPGCDPEIWCPPVRPEEQAPPVLPTSWRLNRDHLRFARARMYNRRDGPGILAGGAARHDLPAEQVERWGWERRVPTAPVWEDHPGKPADAEAIWSAALEALQLDPPGRLTRPVGTTAWAGPMGRPF